MGYAATRSPSEVARRPDDSAFVDMEFLRFAGWPGAATGPQFSVKYADDGAPRISLRHNTCNRIVITR
jgi:hypothetical protein